MTLYFQDFIKDKIDPSLVQAWTGTVIHQVEVCKRKKAWRIELITEELVHSQILEDTRTQLRDYHEFLEDMELVPVWRDSALCLQRLLDERKEDLSSSLFQEANCAGLWPELTLKFDHHRIDIVCESRAIYEQVIDADICTRLAEWLWREYLQQVLVRAILAGQGQSRPIQPALISHGPIDTIVVRVDQHSALKKGAGSRDRKKRTAPIRENAVPIIGLEEGQKNAVVAGEVWNKEITTYNEGNLRVDYWLSDGSDSVVVRAFWDHSAEDKIEIGDHIKVKGSYHVAKNLKEPALYLLSYNLLDKVLRQDNSPHKRIELHAHTKMSSLDGLTEIKELIQRAADWGHPAVAITDHACIQAFPVGHAALQEINRSRSDEQKLKLIYGVEAYLVEEDKKDRPFHIIILARNRQGLKNLYRLVSKSYLDHFYRQPRILRRDLATYREGLLLGTACEAGELFQAILRGAGQEILQRIADFYDYFEVQPRANNAFLLRRGAIACETDLLEINRQIVALGRSNGKPVVATGDVHFLDPEDEKYRMIMKSALDFEDAEEAMPLYLRTTEEMLDEFAYLGEAEAHRIVVDDPARVAEQIEHLQPVPDGFFPPKIQGAEEEITALTWRKAHAVYGPYLPPLVEERIKRELDSIIGHGYSVLYLVAHKLVKKSNEDGYLVGSRGSVGSSLVAFLTGITEVNALPPHYICRACYYFETTDSDILGCGADLPDRLCPGCGATLAKDGFDIPFETFMGFEGDKVPDIDLNFSGDYQSRAHQYVEELFGRANVFRAGTTSTIADKTAFGFVKKYAEKKDLDIKNSEMTRLARGMTGVRRTTGQHPGGLIVVPHDSDILDFTPLQHPADNKESGIITTHFEYHAIGDQLVKLDILGHDDPTVIKELEDLTGIKAASVSLSDRATMQLFSGLEPLGASPEDIGSTVGTLGIPEFGTHFVRGMLETTRPTTFSGLVRISGLSHGTDVWLNNAQQLIRDQIASLSEVICTRDDIMTYLIYKQMDKNQAFDIMERVRKGKGLSAQQVKLMQTTQIPDWYIGACQKIKYMFPKAHAVAYVTMAFRIAWFKINYPLAFYASFFGVRAEDFEASTILAGYDKVCNRIKEIEKMGLSAPQKERKLITILELAREMYARGYHFKPVDIYRSDAHKFIIDGTGLILPFAALPNIGAAAAHGIILSRREGPYISIEDFQNRTRMNKSIMDMLRQEQCFMDLPEKSQISLFA